MEDVYKGSHAIESARLWIGIFSWITIIIGVLIFFIQLFDPLVWMGLAIIVCGISGLLSRSVLTGFYSIVRACEEYMRKNNKNTEE